jgi:hypothetical protein
MDGVDGKLLVDRMLEVLDYFQPQFWWIENPWLSRMRDYIVDLPYVCVDYCRYSDWGYRKRTRLWTNIPFEPRTCDGTGACGNMEGKRHQVNLIDRGGYLLEKYRVPAALIEELLGGCSPSSPQPPMDEVAPPAPPPTRSLTRRTERDGTLMECWEGRLSGKNAIFGIFPDGAGGAVGPAGHGRGGPGEGVGPGFGGIGPRGGGGGSPVAMWVCLPTASWQYALPQSHTLFVPEFLGPS